jgi:putative DNA primase/helicase
LNKDNIPESLKGYPYWCLWRYEEVDGRKTKVPYQPREQLNRASSTNKEHFANYEIAAYSYEKYISDGIGIGIFDDIAAVDIDNCVDSAGCLSEMAQDIISVMDTYTEYSPSGKGIRIIFRAPGFEHDIKKYYINSKKHGLEIYIAGCTNKYVTITGDALNEKSVELRNAEIALILGKYMRRQTAAPPLKNAPASTMLTDDEVIQKAHSAKNGAAFAALWHGDVSGAASQSEADLSLCNMLAFWCGRDDRQIDRLFRQSGLMRDKWDEKHGRDTYGNLTIEKAVIGCREIYTPKKVSNPPAAKNSVKPTDFTDTGNARIFAREYQGTAIYVKSVNWLTWNGMVWVEGKLDAAGLAMKLTDRMMEEARAEVKAAGDAITAAKVSEDDEARKKANQQAGYAEQYRKHARNSRNKPKITAMLDLACTLLQVKSEKLDADAYLLNTPAGMIDLKTKRTQPHDPQAYCTKMTVCSPGDKGQQMWFDFLNTISGGDEKMIDFLQQVAGMAAVGKVFEENLIIAIGDGKNGKSAFFNALAIVLNDYAGTIAAEVLTTANRSKGAEMATLKGKRLIIAAETEEGARLSASMLKQIASTDKIHAERKYKDPEDFTPSHTTILYTNHLPRVGSTDTGTWRRLVLIPFNAKIDTKQEVKNYADVLAREAGPAILEWIIEGAANYISTGHKLIMPEFVHMAIEEYQDANDWMTEFLTEFCEEGQGRSVKARPLYTTYHDWATVAHGYARRSDDFAAELEKRGFQKRKTNTGATWYGISLVPQEAGYGYRSYG